MKEEQKLNLIELLKKSIKFKDGFWIYGGNEIFSNEEVREYIRMQGIPILEKDITEVMSELTFNKDEEFDIDLKFKEDISNKAAKTFTKSKYFASLDKLYPGNKFREMFNYYLFGDGKYCFILIGYGQTGKSTLVNVLAKVIGESFFGRSGVAMLRNQHGNVVLEGKKIFEVAEAQDLDQDTANSLKSMITNDPIMVNPKFEQPRTIVPHVKLIMTCNNMPNFKTTDDGIIRRVIVVEMNNKIEKQNDRFLNEIEQDIPNIIAEALLHPFDIKHWAREQYYFFERDPQYGFGYGELKYANEWFGKTDYEKYQNKQRSFGQHARSKTNFDKFAELAKIYKGKMDKECDTTSKDSVVMSGFELSNFLNEEDVPF